MAGIFRFVEDVESCGPSLRMMPCFSFARSLPRMPSDGRFSLGLVDTETVVQILVLKNILYHVFSELLSATLNLNLGELLSPLTDSSIKMRKITECEQNHTIFAPTVLNM